MGSIPSIEALCLDVTELRICWVTDLQSSLLPNANVSERQPSSNSVSDTQKMKSPWPRNGHMWNDPEKIKKVIHVQRETTIRRENFRNCWPSRRIGSVTTEEWSTNEQMTGLVWVLKTVLPERDFEETAPALGRRLGIGLHPVIHSANFPSRTEWLGTIDLLYTVIRLCHCTALV